MLSTRALIRFHFARDEFEGQPSRREAIEDHIRGCPICRRRSAELLATVTAAAAAAAPNEEATEWAWRTLRAAAERERGQPA